MIDVAAVANAAAQINDRGQLVKSVLGHANQVHAFAGQAGRSDLAGALTAEAARWKELSATVVVAGAQKRGKSRLVNALVGRPNLVPVDADIATHTHLAIKHGPQLTATVHRQRDGRTEEIRIDPEELVDYASVIGDPAKRTGVVRVDIELDHPLLSNVRLVDTPGVDSLTAGHRHVTLASLSQADALLFAVSAERQPVLREELEFLAEAAQRIDTIAFAFTKAEDAEEVRQLLAENRQRLAAFVAEHADGGGTADVSGATKWDPARLRRLLEAPWIPVSAKLAESSHARRAAGQEERAADLWQRSGMDALAGFLRRCGQRREVVRAGNVLVVAGSVLGTIADAERDKKVAADGDKTVAERLKGEQERLDTLADAQRERRRAALEASLLTRQAGLVVRHATDRMRQLYDQELAKAELKNAEKLAAYSAWLTDSLEKSLEAVWLEILAELKPWFEGELAELASDLGIETEAYEIRAGVPTRVGTIVRRDRSRDVDNSFDVVRDGLPGVMGTASLGGLAMHIGLGPVGWIVAPLAIGEMIRRRRGHERNMRGKADLQRQVVEIFNLANSEMSVAVEVELTRRRAELERVIDDYIADQRKEVETRRKEIQTLAKQNAVARQKARDEAGARLTQATQLIEKTDQLRTRVRTAIKQP